MSASSPPAPAAAPRPEPSMGAGRVVMTVAGSLLALLALALLAAGVTLVFAYAFLRDGDGFFNAPTTRFSTPTRALTAERLDLGDVHGGAGDWAVEHIAGRVRVRAELAGGAPVFVGIARDRDVARYLSGTAHARVTDLHPTRYVTSTGGSRPAPPARQSFWVASAQGGGERTAQWDPQGGRWAVVVMRADARAGVTADVRVGAKLPWALWVGLGLLGLAALVGGGGGALIWAGVHRRSQDEDGDPGAGQAIATTRPAPEAVGAVDVGDEGYPATLVARLDAPLSPWLWLVKWFLAIPHAIVLALLWAAWWVVTVIAFFAILFTGRYPRGLFDFNVGVLRWTWRVGYYATSAIATDRYPPFSLAPDPSYPADLDIAYPERLSRGLVLVKWWLLAIPHYLIVAAFLGGGWWFTRSWSPGLLTVLVLVAGVSLLFTGRYPRDVHRFVVGINRWLLRVVAYAGLMRDEYPPFRLDQPSRAEYQGGPVSAPMRTP